MIGMPTPGSPSAARGAICDSAESRTKDRELARSRFILEPYDNPLSEGSRELLQRREAGSVLTTFETADRRHAGSHSPRQLLLG